MGKQLLQFFFDMPLPLLAGYLLRRRSQVPQGFFDNLITINITVMFPLLCLFSLWVVRLSPHYLFLPLLGVIQQLIPGAAAYGLSRRRLKDPVVQGSFVITGLLSNRAMLGSLALFILLGEQSYALGQLVVLLESTVTFIVAFSLAQYYRRQKDGAGGSKLNFRQLYINRNMIPFGAMVAGLLLNYSGLPRPAAAGMVFPYLIHLNSWSALVPVGSAIKFAGMKKWLKPVAGLTGIKFLVAPLVTLLMVYPFRHDLNVVEVLMVFSFAPAAIFSVVAAQLFRLEVDLAVAAFVATTTIYLALIFPGLALASRILY